MKTLLLLLIISCTIPKAFTQSDTILSKKEQRFIHPKSKYLSFSLGLGFTSIVVSDPNNFLTQGIQMQNNVKFPDISYEQGIRSNVFFETGYSYYQQGVFFGRKVNDISFSSYYLSHFNHYLNVGSGYRLISKNNLHFLNIHGGFFIGISKNKINDLVDGFHVSMIDEVTNLPFSIVSTQTSYSRLSLGAYLGISKEFRLSQDVRLFVKYIQRFGLKTTIGGEFILSSNEIDFINEPATYKVLGGGGAFLSLGLKIQLFKNKLK